ncbi:hypothetical protein DPMN_034409 [Dreissena polymorpha]|uniref:Uncharacterized protein n=1 Tax=Dreissena polymorpha TaxID=45954 RepID=A0A9D4RM28_DREPO|nr:hypothetical protein DPMN_034409 [Dreissena polymorpha]
MLQIDRVIPIACKAELTNFSFLFWAKAKTNLTDSHIWFSIFQRPAKSNFTRVQRLTCCLSLIFCSMCASIAWYGQAAQSDQALTVGPVKISLAGVYVGILSSAMTLPINLIIVLLFRCSRPLPQKPKHNPNALISEKKSEEDGNEKITMDDTADLPEICNEEEENVEYFIEDEFKNEVDYLNKGDNSKKTLHKGEVTAEDAGLVQIANIPLSKDLVVRLR